MSVSAQTRGCNAEMVVFLEHKVEQLEQQLASAHRAGWERAKAEAADIVIEYNTTGLMDDALTDIQRMQPLEDV